MSTAYAGSDQMNNWYKESVSRVRRELVDLHTGEFCVDVSTWGDVIYEPVEREKCDSIFTKVCEDKNKQVSVLQSNLTENKS